MGELRSLLAQVPDFCHCHIHSDFTPVPAPVSASASVSVAASVTVAASSGVPVNADGAAAVAFFSLVFYGQVIYVTNLTLSNL